MLVERRAATSVRDERRVAGIDDLVVRPDRRRHGAARRRHGLVRGEPGMASVELTVWEFNDEARAFYKAHSFQTLVHRMGGRFEPALFPATPG